jgi:hypothetical protein
VLICIVVTSVAEPRHVDAAPGKHSYAASAPAEQNAAPCCSGSATTGTYTLALPILFLLCILKYS